MQRILLISLVLLTAMAGCKNKEAAPQEQVEAAAVQKPEGPRASGLDREREEEFKSDGKTYFVHIVCEADSTGPAVKDETGEYFEQKARLTVTRDGEQIVDRTFTKADFSKYLTDEEAARFVIQGMLLNPSKASNGRTLNLAAQLCSPSDEEDCRPFTLTYNMGDGTFSVKQEALRITDPEGEAAEDEGV